MPSQREISPEIAALRQTPLPRDPNRESHRPLTAYPPYRSSLLRHPTKNLELTDPETIELTSPAFGPRDVGEAESDLTTMSTGERLGERMVRVGGGLIEGPIFQRDVMVDDEHAARRTDRQRVRPPAPFRRGVHRVAARRGVVNAIVSV